MEIALNGKTVEKLERIDSDLLGIGELLESKKLSVPSHQRPYAWEDQQVEDLFRDINDALNAKQGEYFLGTVVLTEGDQGRKLVIDGQQRLVTCAILIAAMRDYFVSVGQEDRAKDIEQKYLFRRNIRSQEVEAHIHLIPEDREFFLNRIIANPKEPKRTVEPANTAQKRLVQAASLAASFIKKKVDLTQQKDDAILDYLEFIHDKSKVISVEVDSEANAYLIFEVLNDRGLDLSLIDLLKNYVFSFAAEKLAEVQSSWAAMVNAIADIGDEGQIKTFVRHAWVAKNGLTREKDLYAAIKKEVTTKSKAVDFAAELAKTAAIYAAVATPSHGMWNKFAEEVSQSLEVFDLAGVTQIRPLLLAILKNFEPAEVNRSFPMMVAWTVRFLVTGAGGSGILETGYAECAKAVSQKNITDAKGLWAQMEKVVPDDISFEQAFAKATVSKVSIAKYYLRVLNQHMTAGTEELIVNPDKEKVNIEHILPETITGEWLQDFTEAQHKAYLRRIGNLTLLGKKLNSKVANNPFSEKQKEYDKSEIKMSKELCAQKTWTPADIDARQAAFAKLAVKIWSPKPR